MDGLEHGMGRGESRQVKRKGVLMTLHASPSTRNHSSIASSCSSKHSIDQLLFGPASLVLSKLDIPRKLPYFHSPSACRWEHFSFPLSTEHKLRDRKPPLQPPPARKPVS
jgi:hypothetical protein